jgi:hypothetical protein
VEGRITAELEESLPYPVFMLIGDADDAELIEDVQMWELWQEK